MELTNEFDVAVPVQRAWDVLTDVEQIAPCLPGAELREVEGDEYRGSVKVKVGPITTSYKGVARFMTLDEANHCAVLKAEGRETRGQGNASAVITATMSPSDQGTRVTVVTDLSITGKVAQFGRGVLADVSAKLLDQFVANLESTVLAPGGGDLPSTGDAPADAASSEQATPDVSDTGGERTPASPPGPRRIESGPAAPVDLVQVAGSSVARRMAPPIIAAILLVLAIYAVRHRRRRRR